MKYQIHEELSDSEYYACKSVLRALGLGAHQWPQRNALFEDRALAERVLGVIRSAAPEAPVNLRPVTD
jgi:hypothetical protein